MFPLIFLPTTAQKMKFFIKDFFSKCDQIRIFLWIWSYLPKKYLMENFIFCAVYVVLFTYTKSALLETLLFNLFLLFKNYGFQLYLSESKLFSEDFRLVFLPDIRLSVMCFVEILLQCNYFVHCINSDPFLGELLL